MMWGAGATAPVLTPLRAVKNATEGIPVVEAAFIWKTIVPRAQSESTLDRCSGGAQDSKWFIFRRWGRPHVPAV